jgi:hypothetical protein
MAKSRIYIKPSKRGSLRRHLKTPKGKNIPASQLTTKKGDSAAIRKKKVFARNARKWNRQDGGDLNDFFFVADEQGELQLGGVLTSATQGAMSGMALGPWGALAGAGIGLIRGLGQQEQEQEPDQFEPNIIKSVNPYTNAPPVQNMQDGGNLTRYQGPAHEDGGMNIGPAEVEGGENEFDMVVNSDTKRITSAIVKRYGIDGGGRVPISKRHIGKTPAEVAEEIDNRYKKFHPYDPFLVSDKEYLSALSDMSEDLADEITVPGGKTFLKSGGRWVPKKTRSYQGGGDIPGTPPEGPLYDEMSGRYPKYGQLREATYKHGLGERFDDLTRLRNYQGQLTGKFAETYPDIPVQDILSEAQRLDDPMTILNTSERGQDIIGDYGDFAIQPKEISEFLGADSTDYWKLLDRYAPAGTVGQDQDEISRQKFGVRSMIMPRLRSDTKKKGEQSIGMGPYQFLEGKRGGGSLTSIKAKTMLRENRAQGKTLSPKQKRFFGWVAGGRKQKGGNLFMDPEGQFKPGTALGLAPMATNLLQYGMELSRPDEKFNYPTIGSEEFEPLDPTQTISRATEGFGTAMEGLRRSGDLTPAAMIQLATEQGKVTGDITDQFNLQNVQGRNRMADINQRAKMFNAGQKTREQIDASANRGASLTRRSAFLSGIGTGLGQLGRDINLQGAQTRGINRYYDFMERAFPNYFKNQGTPSNEDQLSDEEREYDLYG